MWLGIVGIIVFTGLLWLVGRASRADAGADARDVVRAPGHPGMPGWTGPPTGGRSGRAGAISQMR